MDGFVYIFMCLIIISDDCWQKEVRYPWKHSSRQAGTPGRNHIAVIKQAYGQAASVVEYPLCYRQRSTIVLLASQGITTLNVLAQNEPNTVLTNGSRLPLIAVYKAGKEVVKKAVSGFLHIVRHDIDTVNG